MKKTVHEMLASPDFRRLVTRRWTISIVLTVLLFLTPWLPPKRTGDAPAEAVVTFHPDHKTVAIRFADRDENAYFHTKADDEKEPFKKLLETKRKELGDKSLEGALFAWTSNDRCHAPRVSLRP